MKSNHMRNEGKGYTVFSIFNFIFMIFIILITLIPYLNVLAKAFNDGTDSLRGGITIVPRIFTTENFKVLLKDSDMYMAAFVTIMRVLILVVSGILVQFMTAYTLSRKNLWGMKAVNVYFLIPMFVSGGLIPQYVLFSKIHLLNNFWVYVLPAIFSFYNVMLIRSYISSSISDEIIEAARIDGSGEGRILLQFIIPLSMPILATIALWTAVGAWNDWTTTMYYITDSTLYTLQYKLMQTIKETERMTALVQNAIESGQNVEQLMKSMTVTTESVQSAQIIVVTLPIICVYPFLQKYFVKGITLGSVKG